MAREKIIKDIGALDGRLLVFGGVYSNYQALLQLQQIATDLHIPAGNIIYTGDIVGYCAQPQECIDLIKEWGIHTIAGNVEIQLSEGADDCGCDFGAESRCDVFSRNWYRYAQQHVSASSLPWLAGLPDMLRFNYGSQRCLVVHGSFFHTSEFIFGSTPWEQKARSFVQADVDVIFAGHCGLPFADRQNGHTWLNAGVIGMPANDGQTSVWYLTANMDANGGALFDFHTFQYDHLLASKLMEHEGLPLQYARTLLTGIWDNCEILPEKETSVQGKPIDIPAILNKKTDL